MVTGNTWTDRYLDATAFAALDEVWKYAWDDDLGTVPAAAVTDRAVALARERDPERLVVHYMQPHHPFVPLTRSTATTGWLGPEATATTGIRGCRSGAERSRPSASGGPTRRTFGTCLAKWRRSSTTSTGASRSPPTTATSSASGGCTGTPCTPGARPSPSPWAEATGVDRGSSIPNSTRRSRCRWVGSTATGERERLEALGYL